MEAMKGTVVSFITKQQINYQNIKMVLLKTLLIVYTKNEKKHNKKSVQSYYKIGILKNFAK